MREYRYLSLAEIKKHEPEMQRLGVSKVARSPRGFLTAFKRAGGKPDKLSLAWKKKRNAFIARTLPNYRKYKTYRIWLSLVAWAYKP